MRDNFGSSVLRTKSIDVLLVGGEREARHQLQQMLEENGCIARAVGDAYAASGEVRRRRPEVLVIDASEPDAVELALAVADESLVLGAVAVLALGAPSTPSSGVDDVLRAFDACIRRPFDVASVVDVVRRLGADMRAARAAAREAAS